MPLCRTFQAIGFGPAPARMPRRVHPFRQRFSLRFRSPRRVVFPTAAILPRRLGRLPERCCRLLKLLQAHLRQTPLPPLERSRCLRG